MIPEDLKVGDRVRIARKPTYGQGKYEHGVFRIGDVLEIETIEEYPLHAGKSQPGEAVAFRIVDDEKDIQNGSNWVGIDCLEPLYEPVSAAEEDEVIRRILKGSP